MNKDDVIRLRLNARDKATIRQAADEAGESMSTFVLEAALSRAGPGPLMHAVERNGQFVAEPIPGQLQLSGGLTLSERSK